MVSCCGHNFNSFHDDELERAPHRRCRTLTTHEPHILVPSFWRWIVPLFHGRKISSWLSVSYAEPKPTAVGGKNSERHVGDTCTVAMKGITSVKSTMWLFSRCLCHTVARF